MLVPEIATRGTNILWPLHIFIDKRKKMASIGGLTIEQKIVTVASYTDEDVNSEINVQAEDNWTVQSLTLSGSDIIILFSRTLTAA